MKTNIKGNREKFKKQEREFEGLIENENKSKDAEIIDIDGADVDAIEDERKESERIMS